MALEVSWLTKHERYVLTCALAMYRRSQHQVSTKASKACTRSEAGANEFVAGDILRQLNDR